jgi:lipoyl(octanoyl) transferase
MTTMHIYKIPRVSYERAHSWQRERVDLRHAGQVGDALVLLEHPSTYTCGRATSAEHLPQPAWLRGRSVHVVEIERGGSVTYHGPGQLVGYPIIDLRERGRDVHRYLRDLEDILIAALRLMGVEGTRREGLTGVWVGEEKIAAIGIHVSRWITSHGFALNIAPDLDFFRAMRPCGLSGDQVTSLEKVLGHAVERDAVEASIMEATKMIWQVELTVEAMSEL